MSILLRWASVRTVPALTILQCAFEDKNRLLVQSEAVAVDREVGVDSAGQGLAWT